MEQPASYYDEIFRTSQAYAMTADEAPWSFLWRWCASHVDPDDTVLDLGCGPGHLASMLRCRRYLGIDFSVEAIAQAIRRCPGKSFMRADLPHALHWIRPCGVHTVVACEFLEHVADDLKTLDLMEHRVKVVATLPRKNSAGHVRWFKDASEAQNRYVSLLDIEQVMEWPSHIGIVGYRL